MLARHSGFNSALLMRGTEGGVTPSLRKRGEFGRYWEQSEDFVVEADTSKIGIEQENRLVPIAHALMQIIDREFGPDENQCSNCKTCRKGGSGDYRRGKTATCDALLYSASLTLWHLGRYDSVPDTASMVREILFSCKAAVRFRRAA